MRILLNPNQDQGGSGSQGISDAQSLYGDGQSQGDGQQQQPPQQGVEQSQAQQGAAAAAGQQGGAAAPAAGAATITPEALAQAMRLAGVGQPAQPQQAEPQMTEEEFKKAFHVFEATDELLAGLSHEDPAARRAAYNEMGKRMVMNAVAIAQHFIRTQTGQIESRFSPALQMAEEARYEKLKTEFFTEYADLKGHDRLVDMAATQLKASGFKGTFKEGAAAVAATVRQILKNLPGGAPAGQQQNGQQQAPASHSMSTVTTGGQSGAGGAAQQQQNGGVKQNPLAKQLFGPRR